MTRSKVVMLNISLIYFVIKTMSLCAGMIKDGFGHIVNISSIAGKYGNPGYTTYSSAKFAIFGLMDSLRYEVRLSIF